VNLNDGQAASLSWLEEDDLPEVMEALNSVIREGKYLLMNKEIPNLESERQWFKGAKEKGVRSFVARVEGKVVGGAGLEPFTDKRAHVAELGIYILKSYRNCGLGTILIKEFIEVAKKSGFEIVQLSAFSTNKRAMHVYRKCGFKKCGKLTRDIKFSDGTYADRIMMEFVLVN